jgi:hypothetical protein
MTDSEALVGDGLEKGKFGIDVMIPEGLSISELRRELPPLAQLIVTFRAKEDLSYELEVEGRGKFRLATNRGYVVGSNPKLGGDLYLNMLGADDDVSDIPGALDLGLAKRGLRGQMGVEIVVRSDDVDVARTIEVLLEKKRQIERYQRFETEFFNQEGDIRKMIEEAAGSSGWQGIKFERMAAELCVGLAMDLGYEVFMECDKKGVPVEWSRLNKKWVDGYLEKLLSLSRSRIDELRSCVGGENDMVLGFDNLSLGNTGLDVVTVLRPGRGWAVVFPNSNCPQHAAAAIRDQVTGSEGRGDFPNMTKQVEEAIADGDVVVDRDRKVMVFRKMDTINPYMAVFHGDGNLVQAMETLRMAGDPYENQVFGQIVISKGEVEEKVMGEKITITFDNK